MSIKHFAVARVDMSVVQQGASATFAALAEVVRALEDANSDVELYEINYNNSDGVKATFMVRPKVQPRVSLLSA